MGNFIWIIIIFVVISIISSAVKKSKQKAQDNDRETPEGPSPVRPPAVSDIQRAFQLMSDFDEPESPKADIQKVNQPYVHSEGTHYHHEGVTSHEGTHTHSDGRASKEGTYGQRDGKASHEGTHTHNNGRVSSEGMHGHEGVRVHSAPQTTMKDGYASALSETYSKRVSSGYNKYAKGRLGEISNRFEQDADAILLETKKKRQSSLALFENQNELVKAVVYSEILQRKSAGR